MGYTVSAGNHTRINCPVTFLVDEVVPGRAIAVRTDGGAVLPAQYAEEDGKPAVVFMLDYLPRGEKTGIEIIDCPFAAAGKKPPMRGELKEDRVEIVASGESYTKYYFGRDLAKPYLGPLYDKFGGQITRLDFTIKEHPHHRSLWFSHGSVNGVDTWNEPEGVHGFILNHEIAGLAGGGAFMEFTAKNTWTDHGKKPLLEDETTVRFYNTPASARLIDTTIRLRAAYGEVTLGRTKEAGPVAVRMNDHLRVTETGTMESGCGGVNEKEIWMKRAPWCDYYGTENGHVCGIAILDSMQNENYPTYWHSRDYGLMAPNNFHILGDRIISEGETVTYRFRVVVHSGSTAEAGIAGKYTDYAFPPIVAQD